MHRRTPSRAAGAVALAAATLVAGCMNQGTPSADKCETVTAPLSDVPTRTDQEPKMRIPVPTGWERTTQRDNESIRYAIRNPALSADDFSPTAVVTLQQVSTRAGKPEKILEEQNKQLTAKLKLTDVTTTPTTVCGAPGLSSAYVAPEVVLGAKLKIPPRTARSLGTVYRAGDTYYVATVTVQTVKPDNPTYQQDSEMILKGFQLLPSQ